MPFVFLKEPADISYNGTATAGFTGFRRGAAIYLRAAMERGETPPRSRGIGGGLARAEIFAAFAAMIERDKEG